jgi:modification methylase
MQPAVAARAIATYTVPGDAVLDPMSGSGTTPGEAIRAGRHAIGVDIEAPFTAIAITTA